jgi:hypothetical protein
MADKSEKEQLPLTKRDQWERKEKADLAAAVQKEEDLAEAEVVLEDGTKN